MEGWAVLRWDSDCILRGTVGRTRDDSPRTEPLAGLGSRLVFGAFPVLSSGR